MAKVVCESCGKQYILDENKIEGDSLRFKCKECGQVQETVIWKKSRLELFESLSEEKDATSAHSGLSTPAPPSEKKRKTPVKDYRKDCGKDDNKARKRTGPIFRSGIGTKLVVAMLFVSVAPMLLLWFVTMKQTSDGIANGAHALLVQTAAGLSGEVEQWVDKNVRVLKTAAGLPGILSMAQASQEPILKQIERQYPWMYLVFTLDSGGMNVARNDGKPLKDYSDRQYYKDVLEGKDLSWQNLIGKTSRKPALVLATPIKSGDRFIGAMASAMAVGDISRNIATWKRGETGFAFLVDEKGKVIAHPNAKYTETQKDLSGHPLVKAFRQGKQAATMQFVDETGRQCLGYVQGTSHGWALCVRQEMDEIFSDMKKARVLGSLLLAVTLCVTLFLAFSLSRTLVQPIRNLTVAADQMSLGDLDREIALSGKDELGRLAQALDRMRVSMKMAMDRLQKNK